MVSVGWGACVLVIFLHSPFLSVFPFLSHPILSLERNGERREKTTLGAVGRKKEGWKGNSINATKRNNRGKG
jgi:hypothetical protein